MNIKPTTTEARIAYNELLQDEASDFYPSPEHLAQAIIAEALLGCPVARAICGSYLWGKEDEFARLVRADLKAEINMHIECGLWG